MSANTRGLSRRPERKRYAADRGEKVVIRRARREYVLTRSSGSEALYGCLKGSILGDSGKPKVRWEAAA